jgi:hypothetical protein
MKEHESMEGVWFWFQTEEYIKSVVQGKSLDSLNWNETFFSKKIGWLK